MWTCSSTPFINHMERGPSGELPLMRSDVTKLKMNCRNVNAGRDTATAAVAAAASAAGSSSRRLFNLKRPEPHSVINLLARDIHASSSSDRTFAHHPRKDLSEKFAGVAAAVAGDIDGNRHSGLLNWNPANTISSSYRHNQTTDGSIRAGYGGLHRYHRPRQRHFLPEHPAQKDSHGRWGVDGRAGTLQRLADDSSLNCRNRLLLQGSLHTLLEEGGGDSENEEHHFNHGRFHHGGYDVDENDGGRMQRLAIDRSPSAGLWKTLLQYQAETVVEQKQSRSSSSIARSDATEDLSSLSSPSSPHSRVPAAAEPLPLLTEIEDFNGSCDDMAVSSLDGDHVDRADGRDAVPPASDGVREERLQLRQSAGRALPRSLSQKYRPKTFEEMVGQGIIVQALAAAVRRGKIAPVYLFHGCRGTGKTTAARIFAAALTCNGGGAAGERQDRRRIPCTTCSECTSVAAGRSERAREVDAASNNGVEKVKKLLEDTLSEPPLPPTMALALYRVLIIDECHVLTTETWNALLKILEEPPENVVFILITTDPDRLPRTAMSRCQRFPFMKIRVPDIVRRLRWLSEVERLNIGGDDVLRQIASQSDGSLRDAETSLEQLSLVSGAGGQLTSSKAHMLLQAADASNSSMLSLLDSSLSGDIVGTVQRVRELVDSGGMEPMSVMSRLASLIADIIAGNDVLIPETQMQPAAAGFFARGQNLSEEHLERLCMAMKTLSEAEKQLRESGNDRMTWLTAALLQLAPRRPSHAQLSSSLDGKSRNDKGDDVSSVAEPNAVFRCSEKTDGVAPPEKLRFRQNGRHLQMQEGSIRVLTERKLEEIWCKAVDRCRPYSVRQLLRAHGRLVSISMSEVDAVIHIEVNDPEQMPKFERWQKMISHALESLLCFPAVVRIGVAADSGRLLAAGGESEATIDGEIAGSNKTAPMVEQQEIVAVDVVDDGKHNFGEGDMIPDWRAKMDGSDDLESRRKEAVEGRSGGGGGAAQKPKECCGDGNLTMMKRLTLKSRIVALPNSDPSSPKGRRCVAASSRSSSGTYLKRQNNSGDWCGPGGDGEAVEGARSTESSWRQQGAADGGKATAGRQRRVGLLRGAAGSLTRFFRGGRKE